MKLKKIVTVPVTPESSDLKEYLAVSRIVDFQHPEVDAVASWLAGNGSCSKLDVINRCFTWVRDEVSHSFDCGATVVTCSASQVLKERTGICYAKSHLLAALLRANGIPAGFCYQRLSIPGSSEGPFSLHGFNAVWLNSIGWFRIDPRGNRKDINAQFSPPVEQLAFHPNSAWGEYDIPGIYAEPLEDVITALTQASTFDELWSTLPDIVTKVDPSN